jgi:hypothetical protein
MSNILTAVKEGIQSYWDNVYFRGSFNQMWILKYWIFWIIAIIVLFQKFRLSFLRFTDHSLWECIKMFQNIIKNAVIFKMVRNATNCYNTYIKILCNFELFLLNVFILLLRRISHLHTCSYLEIRCFQSCSMNECSQSLPITVLRNTHRKIVRNLELFQ